MPVSSTVPEGIVICLPNVGCATAFHFVQLTVLQCWHFFLCRPLLREDFKLGLELLLLLLLLLLLELELLLLELELLLLEPLLLGSGLLAGRGTFTCVSGFIGRLFFHSPRSADPNFGIHNPFSSDLLLSL